MRPRLHHLLLVLLALWVVLLVISLPGQPIQGDEAAFAEFSHYFARDGYVHSELFRGLLSYEGRVLLYHKLFIWLGGVMYKVFPFGAGPVRAISLLASVGLLFGIHRWSQTYPADQKRTAFLAAAVFLTLAPLTFKFAKFFRPEMLQAFLGLLSFLTLKGALSRRSHARSLLAGALAGLAMLTHLNGVVFVIAGGITLLFRRRWLDVILYGFACLVAFAPFFFEVIGRSAVFWKQYTFDPTFGEHERTLGGSLLKLLEEHKRLFRKPEIIFSTVLFLTATIANTVRDGFRARRDFYTYTLACMAALGALAPAKTTPYAILLFPLWALEIGHGAAQISRHWRDARPVIRAMVAVTAVAFIAHSVFADSVNAFSHKEDYVARNRRLAAHMQPQTHVLAPADMVFNEVDYLRISAMRLAHWRIVEWGHKPFSMDNLTAYADSAAITAIVLNVSERRELGNPPLSIGDAYPPFRVTYVDNTTGHVLLKSD